MVTEDQVYNASIAVLSGGVDRVATLTLSLDTSYAILGEAWDKFHAAREKLNEIADQEVEQEYEHNRAKRLLLEVNDLKQSIEAIYALTPLPDDDPEAAAA
jgi:hypothetical protein